MSSIANRFISKEEATPTLADNKIFSKHPESRFALGVFSSDDVLSYEPNSIQEAYLKLRTNVYVTQTGMLSNEVVRQDGTELDEDDERSTHFVVFENRNLGKVAVVAHMRLIEKKDENILPIEKFFPEVFEDSAAPEKSVEVSRFIVSHNEIQQAKVITREMMSAGLAHVVLNELGPVFGVVEPLFERSLKRMGVPVNRIAEPKLVPEYNDKNLGLKIDHDEFKHKIGEEALKRMTVATGSFSYWGRMSDDNILNLVSK
jgi:N-acyl-L-homoserine lactone synthetase